MKSGKWAKNCAFACPRSIKVLSPSNEVIMIPQMKAKDPPTFIATTDNTPHKMLSNTATVSVSSDTVLPISTNPHMQAKTIYIISNNCIVFFLYKITLKI